jgi:hypothetical protein
VNSEKEDGSSIFPTLIIRMKDYPRLPIGSCSMYFFGDFFAAGVQVVSSALSKARLDNFLFFYKDQVMIIPR